MAVLRTLHTPESSNIKMISFGKGVLYVKYKNDATYAFENATLEEFGLIAGSESVGEAVGAVCRGKNFQIL